MVKDGSICGWHVPQVRWLVSKHQGSKGDVWTTSKKQHEAKPQKMFVRGRRRKFLGFMLTHRGIHTNLDKCQAILEIRSPRNMKEAQRLVARIASLSRFLPRIVEKAKSIMNLRKKAKNFQWNDECEETFWYLKVRRATLQCLQNLALVRYS